MRAIQSIHHSTMTLEDIENSIISLQYHLEGEGESGDEKRAMIRRLIERKNAIKGAVLNRVSRMDCPRCEGPTSVAGQPCGEC